MISYIHIVVDCFLPEIFCSYMLLCLPFLLCQALLSWHSQIDASCIFQASCKQVSRISDITLELMTLNQLSLVCNKDTRPWKVLLQLMSKLHPIVLCCGCLNCKGQYNLSVASIISDSRSP